MTKEAEEFFHQYKLGDVDPPPRWAMRFAEAYAKHYTLEILKGEMEAIEDLITEEDVMMFQQRLGARKLRDKLIKQIEDE